MDFAQVRNELLCSASQMSGLFIMAEYPSLLYQIQLDYEHSDRRDTQHGLLIFLVLTDTSQHFGKFNLGLESTSRIYLKRVLST